MNKNLYNLLEEFNKLEEELITLIKLDKNLTSDPVIANLVSSICESVKIRVTTIFNLFSNLSLEAGVKDVTDSSIHTTDIIKAFALFKVYQLILRVVSKTTINITVLLPILDLLATDKNINEELTLLVDALDKISDGN
jgi:hypothetical protein